MTGPDLPLRFPGAGPPERSCDALPMFRGRVRARTLAEAGEGADLTVMATTFAAGAHTVWHTHDSDQLLVVTAGSGELEDESGRTALRAGDIVLVPGGRRHRHLAAPDTEMTHLSVTARGAHHLDPPASSGRLS